MALTISQVIAGLRILPLEARGDSTIIRQTAAKYSSLPETITRNVPNLIMWTGRSCEKQRMILANAQYGSDEGIRRQMIDDLKRKAKDLTMYAGFLKYRLPPWVNDMLARIAAE
jgi:nuclear pore complex protein Nup93